MSTQTVPLGGTVCVLAERRFYMIPVTHVTVRDVPMKNETTVVGKWFVPRDESVSEFTFAEDVEKDFADAETKVVRRGRRPKVVATEGVETK